MAKSALVISTDRQLALNIAARLRGEAFEVTISPEYSPSAAVRETIVILDIESGRGFELCRQVRESSGVPIIVMTDRAAHERAKAFAAGADDCMTKPVNIDELVARATLVCRIGNRRGTSDAKRVENEGALITLNDLKIDPTYHEVRLGGLRLDLTSTEFDLLLLLAENQGHAVSRGKLLEAVWGDVHRGSTRVIDTHICRLRSKLMSHPERPVRLTSIKGFGYRLQ